MYLPKVYQLALEVTAPRSLIIFFVVATERMGLTTQRNQHLAVTEKILAAKGWR
jgi:hypothetical protein